MRRFIYKDGESVQVENENDLRLILEKNESLLQNYMELESCLEDSDYVARGNGFCDAKYSEDFVEMQQAKYRQRVQDVRRWMTEEALDLVQTGDHLHWPCVAAAPEFLIRALVEKGKRGDLKNVEITHLYTEGYADYTQSCYEGIFRLKSFFVGANVRKDTQAGFADYIPCSLSDTSRMISQGKLLVDGVLAMVSPPDEEGYVSLGTSVDCTPAALEKARYAIAQVNRHVPYCYGDARIPLNRFNKVVFYDQPLSSSDFMPLTETDLAIGRHVAALVEDGATLQIGIGNIPNAVLSQLGDHRNLGIHSEMFSDGAIPLIEKGVINGANKCIDKGLLVATFLKGSRHLYDFVNHNPMVRMMDVGYTNDPRIIAKNPKVVAINSALQVDLSGQVCADSIGNRIYSGSGGQLDFMLGANWSEGGVPVIAMPSLTGKGVSKIVPQLTPGAGVVTPRSQVHWVVTEFGAVNLFGKSLQERSKLLISIAHPSVREALERASYGHEK